MERDEFDAAWYLARYPDVGITGIDPYDYHLNYGHLMGREIRRRPRQLKHIVFVVN